MVLRMAKARTAAGFRRSTKVFEDMIAQGGTALRVMTIPGVIPIDGGQSWASFKGDKFPAVAVRDLVIQPRDNDLVIGTHGRGIWIIDDITPLRAASGRNSTPIP